MTEKRFEIKIGEFGEENIVDNLNRMTICEISDMCKKMNDLEEARSYYQENFLTMKTERNQLKKENKELKKENQHIKNTIKEMLDNERTEIGKSVLKQLMEAIQ